MTRYTEDNDNRTSRMYAALDERLNEVAGHRADMYISDTFGLDTDTCYAVVSWAAGLPAVTASNLVEFVGREFAGKVQPVLATAKYFPDYNACLVMLSKYAPTRPIEDTAEMHTVVAGARYLDVDMRDTWDVVSGPNGQKHLRRASEDDVTKMVAERRQRLAQAGVPQLTVANALGAGLSMASTGDIVRCYHQGSVYSDCEVKKELPQNRLTVQIPHVGNVTVAREAIVEIQVVSKKSAGSMKSKLGEYWKKALPDAGYAADLVRELVDEKADSSVPSYWPTPSSEK